VIAAIAFIVLFVVLGLIVLFFAFGGGTARGARENLHRQSRAGRRVAGISVAAIIIAFGIAIPVLTGLDNHHSESRQAPGGVDLTAFQQEGRHLFARNCSTCHTLNAANAVGKVGPNLDQLRPPKALVVNAIDMGRARGQGQMPAQLLTGQDVQKVASFVAATAGR
jgi:mono/diheme cytochrome c family protein